MTVSTRKRVARPSTKRRVDGSVDHFVGEPITDDEARQRCPERYTRKESDSVVRRSDGEEEMSAICHYRSASVDDAIFHLDDDVYVKVLPKFPLPTYDVVKRGVVPNAFSQCLVAYDETEDRHLRKALVLADAISDLPKVGNHQPIDVMEHRINPKTEFQRYIRLNRKDMEDYSSGDAASEEGQLFDHRPLELNNDDYERVRQITVKKGANFRDLKGVQVPDYAMTFKDGKSLKPSGRLWWDETVPTVVTRAEPHIQIIMHPTQERVLTIRENARLQGFPDYYRLFGPIKQKYIQVGNAVAIPVARALGYSLGQSYQSGFDGDQPLFKLPDSFGRIDQATDTRSSAGTLGGGSRGVRLTV